MLPGAKPILCAILVVGLSASAADTPVPFWRAKEKVYQRIENGEIIVVVKTSPQAKGEHPRNRLRIEGGGFVKAPADFVYHQAMDFDHLAAVSGYIQSAKYDAASHILDLAIAAYGYKGKMKLKMRPAGDEDEHKSLGFEVIEGAMKGLSGVFEFRPTGAPNKSEVGIDCDFRYDEFPVPKVFLQFGLEVVFQRMAQSLRAHVEKEFRR